MANEEVLGPRKTMFVLVIVVGCFAVLWPRILSPLILGNTREQLKPNQFDREAGCCEVIFETEVAVLELLNEVCSSVVHVDGKLSPYAAAECRKAVNETCGVDIAAFLKRDENVGRTTKKLVDMMKSSNSSCLKEHYGIPQWSISSHLALNSWTQPDTLKQERPPMRTGPHPALRERGRAIPAGAPAPPPRTATMPPHARVRSPLSVYYELDIKPPPIPGMRPPLGSPGGPVTAPKSSMGFVMPIYTICIIVFFVYTLSKILFKRTGSAPYEPLSPDPQFRRRVFRDDSRSSPDKLGPKERDTIVTAISGLVAEVQQQMEASYAQNQQRQELQDNHTRPYTNGTVLHSTGPVHIVASEYKERSPGPAKESTPEPKESTPEPKESAPEPKESVPEPSESVPEPKESTPEPKESTPEPKESTPEPKESTPEPKESTPEPKESTPDVEDLLEPDEIEEDKPETDKKANGDLIKLTESLSDVKENVATKSSEDFLKDAREDFKVVSTSDLDGSKDKKTTSDLLEEALKEDSPEKDEDAEEKSSVKVVGMELTAHTADGGSWRAPPPPPPPPPRAHEAEEVKSIFLETEIPQQSRVLVAEFEDRADKRAPTHHSPMVVSGKMTLSLIQDAPRDTPDRDLESTVDDFTTASAVTQPAAEKEEDLSEEEVDQEIEVEEIEEEVEEVEEIEEEVEEAEDEEDEPAHAPPAAK